MTLDVETYLRIPRFAALRGGAGRMVLQVDTPGPDGGPFRSALWSVRDSGVAARLTAPREQTSPAGFLPDGSLLFRSRREDPEATDDSKEPEGAALWLLPGDGGEARRVATTPAGIGAVQVARERPAAVFVSDVFPSAASLAEDAERFEQRRTAGTTALWFDEYPIRFWDHHLAPRAPRLFALDIPADGVAAPRDLTGNVGQALREASFAVTADGTRVVTTWQVPLGRGELGRDVVVIDVATGERRVLLSEERVFHTEVAVSPDGEWCAVVLHRLGNREQAPTVELWAVALSGGHARRLAESLDRWPSAPCFTDDSRSVLFLADDEGRGAVHAVPVDAGDGPQLRLSRSGHLSDLHTTGGCVYALRSTLATPPELVRLELDRADQEPRVIHAPVLPEAMPGSVTEVEATAADGAPLRAWLVLPADAGLAAPAPLVVMLHGGPLSSWNGWSWRWQPQLLAARGYAVLLPDPALSTGYGQHMVERGWGQWGGAPYTDSLALVDAAVARDDIDAARTAVTGGSYGGYLTNWTVGHTDRFRCAVTHASLWSLTAFHGTTDDAPYWENEFGDPRKDREQYEQWSPSTYVDAIRTPTLLIHGEQDYRVAVSESLALFTDLQRRGVESALLYLPDENHWVLKPGNIRVWYDAVLGWLDHHLRDLPWDGPALTR